MIGNVLIIANAALNKSDSNGRNLAKLIDCIPFENRYEFYTYGNPDGLHTSSVLFFPKSYNNTIFGFPKCLIKKYVIEVSYDGTTFEKAIEVTDNHQRFIKHNLSKTVMAVRLIPLSTYHSETKTEDYGSSTAHIFNFELF